MDQIKEAFGKVKSDMDVLSQEILSLKKGFGEMKEMLLSLCTVIEGLERKKEQLPTTDLPSTHNPQMTTTPTHTPTDNMPFKPQEAQNLPFSTGNGGVPTDRQTDRQTDQQTQKSPENAQNNNKNSFNNASEILSSLDSLKKELRLKFKRLTDQEFLVFSTLYQLDEEEGHSDYKLIAKRLGLTESSIRDYVGRLIGKGIPVEKAKINNKTIQLSLSSNLKKIASLSTIMQLREI